MNGKIASLPDAIRDEVNRRLEADGEPRQSLLDWLNSLPDVQACLAQKFEGQPISHQNLNQWTKHGFRNWKMRRDALEFTALNAPAATDPNDGEQQPAPDYTTQLVQWLGLRLAATAHSLAPDDQNPDRDLRRLRGFASDIVSLRRGDLSSRRVSLEERRLAILEAQAEERSEAEFWEWTKRPAIRAELFAQALQSKMWHDMLRKTIPAIAPFLPQYTADPVAQPDEHAHPACLI